MVVVHGKGAIQALGAALLATLLIGSPALGEWLRRNEFSSLPRLNPLLKPPAVRVVEGESVDGFLARAGDFKAELDKARH